MTDTNTPHGIDVPTREEVEAVAKRLEGAIEHSSLYNNAKNAVLDAITALRALSEERERSQWVAVSGVEVDGLYGFNPDWVDADFCPQGIREIAMAGDRWVSARWDAVHDCWNMDIESQPTHVVNRFPLSPPTTKETP